MLRVHLWITQFLLITAQELGLSCLALSLDKDAGPDEAQRSRAVQPMTKSHSLIPQRFCLFNLNKLFRAGAVAMQANLLPPSAGIPHGQQVMSQLLYFWTGSLLMAWGMWWSRPKALGFCTLMGDPEQAPDSWLLDWLSSGCHGLLGIKPVDRRFLFVCLYIYL